jgi:DNA (cytosine-5)-methyltransferase 1
MQTQFCTVEEAAALLGLSPHTIRRWEKKGLLKPRRTQSNHRLFDLEEVRALHAKSHDLSGGRPFRVLRAPEETEYEVVELFSGCGGLALGLENAGLRNAMLVEMNDDCVSTLKANRRQWSVVPHDVTRVDFRHLSGRVDVVVGGFPCQAFSYAGQQRGFEDTRGTLFFQFARCVEEIRPKIAVAENVRGLLRHDQGRTLATMVRILTQLDYQVGYHLLRAQFLDVPQKRERVLIVAVRNDMSLRGMFVPREQNYTVSLREALENCPTSPGAVYSPRKREIMKMVPEGGYWRDLPTKVQREYMKGSLHLSGGKTGMARRLAWNEPALTLTCNPAQTQTERCHPTETRPLTVREYARIQSFPDEWCFTGSINSQYRQIGNAVPVNLGFHIGRCIIAMLEDKFDPSTMEEIVFAEQRSVVTRSAQLKLQLEHVSV